MSMILGHPSLDFPEGLRVVGGQMGGGFPAPPLPSMTSFNGSVTFFITCEDSGGTSTPMNLVIAGGRPQAANNLPLILFNSEEAATRSLRMFIKGAGSNPGYAPLSEDMNLHLERGPNAGMHLFLCNTNFGKSMPLYIRGTGFVDTYLEPPVETIPASIFGLNGFNIVRFNVQSISDLEHSTTPFVPLYINGYGGIVNDSVDLFISGALPVGLNSQVTLVIPSVAGIPAKTLPLYVNGFNY